jgi:putative tryptophan/tyrosine transport system substrate-binding protein
VAANWPLVGRAQQLAMPVIGFLHAGSPEPNLSLVAAFRKGLSEMGYVEARNVAIEFRWAQNKRDQLSELAADLVRRKVNVIATPGNISGALAAKALTTTIPIVFSTGADPVALGLVPTLNRPGANVTGYADITSELLPKQFGLLHELVPGATQFGVLVTKSNPWINDLMREVQSAGAALGREVEIAFGGTDREVEAAFANLVQKHVDALLVPSDVVLASRQAQILTLAARHSIPAIYYGRSWVTAGGLMSYASDPTEQGRQAGIYTGRVLKGEKPADMPVMRATKFELIINLSTARAFGLEVPPTLLAIADELIE